MVPDGLADAIAAALTAAGATPPDVITLERPRVAEHGDWSSNAVMAVAKSAGRPPRELAADVAQRMNAALPAHVTAVEIAGPGFLNVRVAPSWGHEVLRRVLVAGTEGWARHETGGGSNVNLEFVSANPTGPLHAGHGRWAAYGDSLGRVLERCGYRVHREFYVNDRGVQMRKYAASLLARRDGADLPEGGYAGQYVIDWAAEMPATITTEDEALEWGLVFAHEHQRSTLARMGVEFATWRSERELVASGAMDDALAELRARGQVYEAEGATWLATEALGDDKDRVVVKADGEPTYFLPDIAYHRDKYLRGFDHLINVLGADHHGYVARMKAAVQALGHEPDSLEILIGQNVVLLRAGAEVKLSKRAGDIVELGEVLDEVGADATRFTYLLQSIDTKQTFDIDLVVSQTMDNPVFYVQMAHARLAGIVRNAVGRGVERAPLDQVDLGVLVHERESTIVRLLGDLPDVVLDAADKRSPSRITTWVRELAAAIHGFHHDCWVVADDVAPELTQARLWLCEGARVGLAIGLDLLGVSAPEEMR